MRRLNTLILDASALIQGYSPSANTRALTVPAVLDEIKDSHVRLRVEALVTAGGIIVRAPDEASRARLEEAATSMGEAGALSEADKEVLSLALLCASEGLDPMVVSDDYSIQNMADQLGFKYRGLAMSGIQKQLRWVTYCPGCRRRFNGLQRGCTCPHCGTSLKKKPVDSRDAMRGAG